MNDRLRREIYVATDGVRLIADRGGDPKVPAVILLHGGGQTRHSWSGALASLVADGFQALTFDARGHGESDWSPEGAYGLSDRAGDLATIAATLDVPFILVGASLGGATSIMAIDAGLRPAGLVLVDIVPEPERRGVDRIVAFMRGHQDGFASVEDAAEAVAAYNPARRRPADSRGLMKNLRARDGRYYWHWDPRILDTSPALHAETVRKASNTLSDLPDLAVMLVRGLSSDVVGEAGVAAFRSTVPRLELFDVAGAGHMVAGDRNDAFNRGVTGFAKRVLRGVTISS
jgi:pimeloyl-ACP methyl ester carboxylesterase